MILPMIGGLKVAGLGEVWLSMVKYGWLVAWLLGCLVAWLVGWLVGMYKHTIVAIVGYIYNI